MEHRFVLDHFPEAEDERSSAERHSFGWFTMSKMESILWLVKTISGIKPAFWHASIDIWYIREPSFIKQKRSFLSCCRVIDEEDARGWLSGISATR